MFPLVKHMDPQSRMVLGLNNFSSSLPMTKVNLLQPGAWIIKEMAFQIWWHIWTPIQNINSPVDTLKTSSRYYKSVMFSNDSWVVMFSNHIDCFVNLRPFPYRISQLYLKIKLTKSLKLICLNINFLIFCFTHHATFKANTLSTLKPIWQGPGNIFKLFLFIF